MQNMQAIILSLYISSTPFVKTFFLKVFMLHIKLIEMEHSTMQWSTMQAHILSLRTSSTPGVGSKGQNSFFTKSSHVAYQIKGNGS